MTSVAAADRSGKIAELQFATFYVGHMLLGVDIRIVQEINRQSEITQVPHAPEYVRGVINLRGDVATVVDLRKILGLPDRRMDRETRNLIVHHRGEAIGLLVDRISDILTINDDEIKPPPTNVEGVDGRLMSGVCTLQSEIVVLLDIDEVLSDSAAQEESR
jgi:purine-binding chemotaxis protein CheW